jgi:hypothetical protein
MISGAVAVARGWVATVNERDIERLIALADPEMDSCRRDQ